MRRVGVPVLVLALAACSTTSLAATRPGARDVSAYRGLGTWVDVYDYAPAFQQQPGARPPVTPASVDDMAALGVRTIFFQAAQDDARSQGDLADPGLAARFLTRAHRRGLRVIAWYLPKLGDVDADLRRITALRDFRAGGQRFDGVALDLEWTQGVPDLATRNARLVDLSRRARARLGRMALGAIVLEPVLLEVVNRAYWPDFPWRPLRDLYDVWLPMSYWTNRAVGSQYRAGGRYTDENLRRLRADLGRPDAPVHAIGGVADQATVGDVTGFVRAARRQRAIGWSLYDFDTTTGGLWSYLRAPAGASG